MVVGAVEIQASSTNYSKEALASEGQIARWFSPVQGSQEIHANLKGWSRLRPLAMQPEIPKR